MIRQPDPRSSPRYRRWRSEFFRRQGRWGICSLCGLEIDMMISGQDREGRSIDHRIPLSVDPSEFYNLSTWGLPIENATQRGAAVLHLALSREVRMHNETDSVRMAELTKGTK